ncbi:cupin domain-containing protein [Pseudonocardia xishanensis]|uniref:(S)-ureidoglycine aminohydrolase cupin domain-containing protein n=1 Tax=Pseudonocardia xishanensis TaxID=630995 RepID=A0ABP8S084_9PSEU
MTTSTVGAINIGDRNLNPPRADWIPFDWVDPKYGPQTKGEVVVIRPEGTSGSLSSGLWRTGHEIAGCEPDGSCIVDYSAPLGDETMVILEGSAEITEVATGTKHQIAAGTILSHPKNVDLHWEIREPFLKKFWVMWDSPEPATPQDHLFVANINDDPEVWTPYEWTEPDHGPQVCGELFTIRDTGSTGTYLCGLWRTGVGIAGCEPDGTSTVPYTAPLGDETMLILEGRAHLLDEETGQEWDIQAGDVVCLPSGRPVRWTSLAPFVKKFFVITEASAPTA